LEFSSTVDRGAPAITQPNASLFPAPESALSLAFFWGLGFIQVKFVWANVHVSPPFVFEIKYPKTIPPKYYFFFGFFFFVTLFYPAPLLIYSAARHLSYGVPKNHSPPQAPRASL
jgi:hypothetical protein